MEAEVRGQVKAHVGIVLADTRDMAAAAAGELVLHCKAEDPGSRVMRSAHRDKGRS